MEGNLISLWKSSFAIRDARQTMLQGHKSQPDSLLLTKDGNACVSVLEMDWTAHKPCLWKTWLGHLQRLRNPFTFLRLEYTGQCLLTDQLWSNVQKRRRVDSAYGAQWFRSMNSVRVSVNSWSLDISLHLPGTEVPTSDPKGDSFIGAVTNCCKPVS